MNQQQSTAFPTKSKPSPRNVLLIRISTDARLDNELPPAPPPLTPGYSDVSLANSSDEDEQAPKILSRSISSAKPAQTSAQGARINHLSYVDIRQESKKLNHKSLAPRQNTISNNPQAHLERILKREETAKKLPPRNDQEYALPLKASAAFGSIKKRGVFLRVCMDTELVYFWTSFDELRDWSLLEERIVKRSESNAGYENLCEPLEHCLTYRSLKGRELRIAGSKDWEMCLNEMTGLKVIQIMLHQK
jgi:hypothetical protein